MRSRKFFPRFGLVLALVGAPCVVKGVEGDAKMLDGVLTPMGAERSGNSEGTIPDWIDKSFTIPSGYKRGDHHLDPFHEDEPLFVITKDNFKTYTNELSEGHKVLLNGKNGYLMRVYPTRRSAYYPERVYEAVRENAKRASMIDQGEGVENASVGIPFPIPNSALQVMWNHKLRYRGEAVQTQAGSAVVGNKGRFEILKSFSIAKFPYSSIEEKERGSGLSTMLVGKRLSPSKTAGNKILIHESINSAREPRRSWLYLVGQRRTRRAPDLAYDAPLSSSDNITVADNADMFNGAMDRFDWKLLGKREMLVPYNAYQVHSKSNAYKDILTEHYPNPSVLRYELHRVWVVEANLKPGSRHRYARRLFYVDEDSWQILMADQFDGRGNQISFAEAHAINYYEVPLFWSTLEVYYNLDKTEYYVRGLDNEEPMYDFSVKPSDFLFQPTRLPSVL